MRRKAQPMLSQNGQYTLDQYWQALQQCKDLSPITVRNYLRDLRQFIAWCENSWSEGQAERSFTSQAITPSLLIRYRECLQTTLRLKTSTVNRTLMSLKRCFSWARKEQLVQSDPASPIKLVPVTFGLTVKKFTVLLNLLLTLGIALCQVKSARLPV